MLYIIFLLCLYEFFFNGIKTLNLKKLKYITIDKEDYTIISKIRETKGNELYILINSDNIGEKIANDIIFEMSKFKTLCIAEKAYYSAFNIFQLCDKRYITQKTKMKNRKPKNKEIKNKIQQIFNKVNFEIEKIIEQRVKITENEILGKECFKYNMCDEFIYLKK